MAGNFIKAAIRHPGASTAAAKSEGLTVHAWAVKHQHDPGTTGKRARLALTLEKVRPAAKSGGLANAAASK
jgi:hypothetical protein